MRERGTYEFRALHYSTASLHNNYGGDFSIAEGELRGRGGGREARTKVHAADDTGKTRGSRSLLLRL